MLSRLADLNYLKKKFSRCAIVTIDAASNVLSAMRQLERKRMAMTGLMREFSDGYSPKLSYGIESSLALGLS